MRRDPNPQRSAADLIRDAANDPKLDLQMATNEIMRAVLLRISDAPDEVDFEGIAQVLEGLASVRKASPDAGQTDPLLREFLHDPTWTVQPQAVVAREAPAVPDPVPGGGPAAGAPGPEDGPVGERGGGPAPARGRRRRAGGAGETGSRE